MEMRPEDNDLLYPVFYRKSQKGAIEMVPTHHSWYTKEIIKICASFTGQSSYWPIFVRALTKWHTLIEAAYHTQGIKSY